MRRCLQATFGRPSVNLLLGDEGVDCLAGRRRRSGPRAQMGHVGCGCSGMWHGCLRSRLRGLPDATCTPWQRDRVRRERDKQQIGLQRILREHGQQIQQLHEQVGFELQARSGAGDCSYAALTRRELEDLTWHILDAAGFKPSGSDAELLAKISRRRHPTSGPHSSSPRAASTATASTSARYKNSWLPNTSRPLDTVTARLRIAAPSPHWRNTWIFAAGSLVAVPQDHQHQALVELVETIDEHADQRLGGIVPIGPRLALDLIDDGMTRSLPKWRNRLISHALRVLHEPAPPDLLAVTRVLVRFADTDEDRATSSLTGYARPSVGPAITRTNTARLQDLISPIAEEIHASPPPAASPKSAPTQHTRADQTAGWLARLQRRDQHLSRPRPHRTPTSRAPPRLSTTSDTNAEPANTTAEPSPPRSRVPTPRPHSQPH